MERRSFLALLASAPIAALAPLPKLLPEVNTCFHVDWSQIPAPVLSAADRAVIAQCAQRWADSIDAEIAARVNNDLRFTSGERW